MIKLPKNLGPKHAYPRVRPRRLAYYAQLSRPITMFAAYVSGFFAGSAIGGFMDGIVVGFIFALMQGAGQVANQIADVEIDRVVKPYRPLPKRVISKREAVLITLLYVIHSLLLSSLYGARGVVATLLGLFLAVYYSLEPVRAKKRGPFKSLLWQAVARGLYPPLAVYVFLDTGLSHLLPLAFLCFLWVLAFQSTKDFPDVVGDKLYGIRTLPVAYGREGALKVMRILGFTYSMANLAVSYSYSALYLLLIPLAVVIPKLIDVEFYTENNLAWALFYLGLGLHYLVFYINLMVTF